MSEYGKLRSRNDSAWLIPNDGSRTNHRLRSDMRRYADTDEVDLVVVGAGAGGSVLTQRLARAGWSVVCLDAGPFWDPDRDWVSDERGSHTLYWTEPRQIGGETPVPLGSNNSGRGVGGSMVHYAGYTPRFHPSDFNTFSVDGVGADWPISYQDLKGYYELIEAELPVAGQDWPWGDPHRYPHHAHRVSGNGDVFLRGAAAAGIEARIGPVAITNGRFGNRPHCIYRGFCLQGCKVNAKASPVDHPYPRRPRPRGRNPGGLSGQLRSRSTRTPALPPVSRTSTAAWSATSERGPWQWPATASKLHACCCSRPPGGSRTGSATTTIRSAAT